MLRVLLRFVLPFLLSLFFAGMTSAAVVTWDGGGTDDNWGTCNNWSSNACPTSSDIATFDATSTDPVNIAVTLTGSTAPAGIDINTGYTGVITQNAGVSITIGGSNFDQAAGTFLGGDSAITINGSFTLSSGTFTSTSGILSVQGNWTHTAGGTFSHNNGTLRGIGSTDTTYNFATSETFYNFTLDKTTNYQQTISSGDTMIVENAVTLTEGRLQGTGTIEVKGTVSFASTYDHGSANWKFSGTGDQTLTLYDTDDNINGNITVDKASGSFFLGSALTLDCGGTVCNFTITQGTVNLSGFDFRSNDFTLTSGTFTTGAVTVDIDDDLILTDGIFNASTGTTRLGGDFTHISGTGTFNHNNGTFIFDTAQDQTINVGTSESFYNVTMDKVNFLQTISAGDTIVVTGALNLTNGRFGTGTIEAQGAVTVASTYDSDNSNLKFTGNASQTFNLTGAEALFDGSITIDKSGGTVTLASGLTMNAGKAFTMTNGTFDAAGYPFSLNSTYSQSGGTFTGGFGAINIDSTFTLSGGTFTATSGTMTLGAAFTHTAGGTFAHNNGTVEFDGSVDVIFDVATSETFYNVTMNKTGYLGTIPSGDTFIILNALNLTNGRFGTGTLQAQGSVTVGSGYDTGTAVLTFAGSEVQTFTLTGAEALFDGDINVSKAGGAVNLASALTLNSINQDLTIQEGTFDLSGFSLSVSGAGTEKIIVETGGNLQLQGGETITGDSAGYPQLDSGSTVTYDGDAGPYTLKNYTYHHLIIAGAESSVFVLAANESFGGNVTISSGVLSQGGFTLGVTGTFSNLGTLRRLQTETFTGTMDVDSGTVEYVGDGDVQETVVITDFGTTDYFNLKINDTNGTKDVFVLGAATVVAGTLQVTSAEFQQGVNALTTAAIMVDGGTLTGGSSTITVSGSVTISGGVFTASSGTMTVSENFVHTAGTFTHNSGTVQFNNAGVTSTISGNTTFYNFSCTTALKPITFTAGTTQTISGLLTFTGTSGNLIVLRSTITDSAWNLNLVGTSSVDYVNVRDSNAAGGNSITHAVSPSRSVNVANNTNWSFNAAPTVAAVTAVQSSAGDGDVTVTFTMDDPDDDNTLQVKVEYSLNGGSSWGDPSLSVTGSETSASFGDPSINNAVTYQVGQNGAYILSSSGVNTVTIVWEAATDVSASTDISNARIRITPYDGAVEGTAGSSANFTLDRVSPTSLANFGYVDFSSNYATLTWTAAVDTNFNHYEIWSGETESEVIARNGSALEWDNDNDATLATASRSTTTIDNTDPRNKFFKIFAVDNYGNEMTLATYPIGGGRSSASSSSNTSSSSSGSSSGGGEGSSGDSSGEDSSSSSNDSNEGVGGTDEDTQEEDVTEEDVTEEDVTEEDVTEEDVTEEEIEQTWDALDIEPVEEHWSHGYVKYLEEDANVVDVVISVPTFLDLITVMIEKPNEVMSRADSVEFLLALAGYSLDALSINVSSVAFNDLDLEDEQAGFIQFAYDHKLVQGYPDGTFQPGRTVNRAEALKLCSIFFEGEWTHPVYGDELLALYELTESPFADVDLNTWYAPYLINAYAKGVVSGYGDGTFGPGNAVTYAEFLKIAILMQNIEEAVELAEELQ